MSDTTLDDIRERNDIVEVVSRYVTLKKAGAGLKGLCPFHQEKTPSFTVSRDKQVWYCFGCHEGGDVFKFIEKIERMSFSEAAELLAARVGLTFKRSFVSEKERTRRQLLLDANARAARFFHNLLLKDPRGKAALTECEKRGIDRDVVEIYHMGCAADSWDTLWTHLRRAGVAAEIAESAGLIRKRSAGEGYYDYFRNRLMIPIRDVQGHVIGFGGRTLGDDSAKYINSPENEIFSKGKVLFGLNMASQKISGKDVAIVVEGYMDQIALFQHGFENCVATMGTAITPDHLRMLSRYTRHLVIAFDADSAGMNAVLRSAPLFDAHDMRVRIMEVPEGKDPDEYVRQHGAAALQQQLDAAATLIDYRIRQATQRVTSREGQKSCSETDTRTEMIRAVIPILLEVHSPIQLESLIVRLAKEWCAPDLNRIVTAERAIRQEIEWARRRRGLSRPGGAADTASTSSQEYEARTHPRVEEGRKSAVQYSGKSEDTEERPNRLLRQGSGLVKAERDILAAVLQGRIPPEILEQLPPDKFVDIVDKEIASWLWEAWSGNREPNIHEWVSELRKNPQTRAGSVVVSDTILSIVSELLVRDVGFLDVKGSVLDRVEKILSHWKKLEERKSRQKLAEMIDSGKPVAS